MVSPEPRSRAHGVRFAPVPSGPPTAPSRPLVQVGDGQLSRRHPAGMPIADPLPDRGSLRSRRCLFRLSFAPCGTDHEIRANFDREAGATCGGWAWFRMPGALNQTARHTTFSRGVDRWNGMWRDGVSPANKALAIRRRRAVPLRDGWPLS